MTDGENDKDIPSIVELENMRRAMILDHQRKMEAHARRMKWASRLIILCTIVLIAASLFRAWQCIKP